MRDKCHRAGYHIRTLSQIKNFVVHYSGKDADSSAESIDAYHMGPPNSWYGCGYHYVSRWDGTIEQAQGLEVVSYHCGTGSPTAIQGIGSNNWASIGACLPGIVPTSAQLGAVRRLADKVQDDLKRPLNILPHCVISKGTTVCPGDYRIWWPW